MENLCSLETHLVLVYMSSVNSTNICGVSLSEYFYFFSFWLIWLAIVGCIFFIPSYSIHLSVYKATNPKQNKEGNYRVVIGGDKHIQYRPNA